MSCDLVIQDLSYLSEVSENCQLVAGSAFAYASTSAGTGYADATALAFARGQKTITNTQTKALTQYYGSFTFSYGDALASAYAKDGSSSQRAWHSSTSLSFSST